MQAIDIYKDEFNQMVTGTTIEGEYIYNYIITSNGTNITHNIKYCDLYIKIIKSKILLWLLSQVLDQQFIGLITKPDWFNAWGIYLHPDYKNNQNVNDAFEIAVEVLSGYRKVEKKGDK